MSKTHFGFQTVDEQEKAVEVLTANGINVINKEEIYAK
jgi:hypothetical protein